MTTATPAVRATPAPAGAQLVRGAPLAIVAVMSAIVLMGFWPFYSRLFHGGTGAHPVVYVHAAVFSGWMVLLAAQVVLVFRRRVRVHQRLGRVGIAYGLLVLALGLAVTVVAPVQNVASGRSTLDEAAGFLILPLGDMLLFALFFASGIAVRRRRELHGRLMLLATVALLFAPAARIAGDHGPAAVLAVWLLPLGLAMVHDLLTRARGARVYMLGGAVLLLGFSRVFLMESELWLPIGRRLLATFAG